MIRAAYESVRVREINGSKLKQAHDSRIEKESSGGTQGAADVSKGKELTGFNAYGERVRPLDNAELDRPMRARAVRESHWVQRPSLNTRVEDVIADIDDEDWIPKAGRRYRSRYVSSTHAIIGFDYDYD